MTPILEKIQRLRKSNAVSIIDRYCNRYHVTLLEANGSKTAYCFSTPIYNQYTNNILDMRFYKVGDTIRAWGSNSEIQFSDKIFIKNHEGACTFYLKDKTKLLTDTELCCGVDRICMTTNGFAYKASYNKESSVSFTIEVSQPFMPVRSNNKYFAIMSDKFKPLVTVSCLGVVGKTGQIIAPVKIIHKKINDKSYEITFKPCSPMGKWIMFEANMYEPKIFQDTTVESNNPKSNNAFGSIGFIGTTKEFGQQWLYTRPDLTRIPEILDKYICKAILHVPQFNYSSTNICAIALLSRFCSFGSNWNNKVQATSLLIDSVCDIDYQHIDITQVIRDKAGRIMQSEGFILKATQRDGGFCVLATGDNYYAPEILEINFK